MRSMRLLVKGAFRPLLAGARRRIVRSLVVNKSLIKKAFVVPSFAMGAWVAGQWSKAEAFLPEEKHTIRIFREAQGSVVSVTNISRIRRLLSERIGQMGASGFVWDDKGHIVTNYHVIENSKELRVTLPDGNQCTAEIVGSDEQSDLAVLRVPSDVRAKLKPLPKSTEVQVGQKTYAIGYPFGLDQTLTAGLVSGVGRQFQDKPRIFDVIQTDAAINPGSSGGPLLDSRGHLIGINTAIVTTSGGFAGVGYALSVGFAQKIVRDLIRHGRVIRPSIGIQLGPDHYLRQLGFEGALVYDVVRGKPASLAGLKPARKSRDGFIFGDIVVGINEKRIKSSRDVFYALRNLEVGEKITMELATIGANGQQTSRRKVSITLQEL